MERAGPGRWFAVLALVVALTGCASGGAGAPGAARGAPAAPAATDGSSAGNERFAIAKTISDTARAVTDFSRTADPRSVLRFYAPNYEGVQDGDRQTIKDVERLLEDLRDRITSGAPIQMEAHTRNIRVEMDSPTAGWATYELFFAIGAAGRVALAQEARCTGLYRKQGEAWLVRHEHCSTQRRRAVPG